MEKDFVTWFHHQYPDLQSAHSNLSSHGLNIGQQNSVPIYMTPYLNEVPVKEDYSPFSFTGLLESKASQPTEPHNWFHCLPRLCQGVAPQSVDNLGGKEEPNLGARSAEKRFLVFDQSGGQTTLIYSSPNCTPVLQRLPSWCPNPLIKEAPEIKTNGICPSGHDSGSGEYYEEKHRDDVESELHEDTEELNALLYSDDDNDYSEDGEEVSTGHSPSTMTAHEMGEEVASSEWPRKKRKRLEIPSRVDTATSAKPFDCSELEEDDAESSCGNSDDDQVSESVSLSERKRPRNEQILETINILQKIIPGGKGKDSMDVIDEAICYLRSL